jgi:diaminohydroxyphosphoribosylaminopyrimidine deaminase/5-amino-6-(5-phosphoribosylamino)uracil reductase
MRRALELARATYPHPNPRVGAVVYAGGEVVAEAAHQQAGEPHAEVLALQRAGPAARGATVFVTLEPCVHHGRTPPCVDELIQAGVARVVVGATDPDDRVSGKGIKRLREAGIAVSGGVEAELVEAADPGYFHHRRTGLPLVTLKLATTLDGQIAAADRTSRWITGEQARRNSHLLRAESDVVVVGAGTVLADDPQLDVRIDGYCGPQPRPVVVAGARPLPAAARVLARDALVYGRDDPSLPGERVPAADDRRVDLGMMLKDLGARGYVAALVEGGATLAGELLRGRHVDNLVLYLGGKLGAGQGIGACGGVFATIGDAVRVDIAEIARLGTDIKITARVGERCLPE